MLVKSAEYIISATNKKNLLNHEKNEFIFIGKSNVGKSSFINALTNRKNLAYTSSKPGKTITINYYLINNDFYFVDVPGYGYASKEKTDRIKFGKMLEDLILENNKIKTIFLILDIRHEPTEDDALMYEYLKYYNLPITLVATKMDKIGSTLVSRHLKAIRNKLNLDEKTKIIPISSINNKGIIDVENLISEYLKSE